MEKFFCQKCNKIFEAEGIKKEWQDSIYGSCWKRIAFCPICGSETEEIRIRGGSGKKEKGCQGCLNCSGCNF